jgi:integrase
MPKKLKDLNPYFLQVVIDYEKDVWCLKKISTQITSAYIFKQLLLQFGAKRIKSLTRRDCQMYLTEMAKHVAPATVRKHWSVLSGILQYAEDEGLIEGFRKPKLPRNRRKPQQWLTLDEMKLVIAKADPGPLKVLVMLLSETGCRIGEALGLQSKHLNTDTKTLTIEQTNYLGFIGSPKTDSSARSIAITDNLCYYLNQIRDRANPGEFIFHWNYPKVRDLLNKVFDRAGLARRGEHSFRRGNITWLIRDMLMPEIVVGDRVGHNSAGMTLGVYVQKKPGQDREWIPKIEKELYGS